MSVLLLTPKEENRGYEYVHSMYENLGIEYIASYLRSYDIQCEVLNLNFVSSTFNEIERAFCGYHPKLVGVSLPFWESRKDYCAFLKEVSAGLPSDTLLVVGGHAATIGAEYFLNHNPRIASVIMGEGEITIAQMYKAIEYNNNTISIEGSYSRNGFKKRNLFPLDDLPFPARDDLKTIKEIRGNVREAYISSSRGCQGNCSFCSIPCFYHYSSPFYGWRPRSPDKIVEEIKSVLVQFSSVNFFSFVDDNFLGYGENGKIRALQIADKILYNDIDIQFEITSRTDVLDKKVLLKLKRAGLSTVYLGIESGIQRILDRFNKRNTIEKNLEIIETIYDLDLGCDIGFIMFEPTITLDEVEKNLDFVENLIKKYELYIHPGVLIRGLRNYPKDLGRMAIIQDESEAFINGKSGFLKELINRIWLELLWQPFLKAEEILGIDHKATPSEVIQIDAIRQWHFNLSRLLISLMREILTSIKHLHSEELTSVFRKNLVERASCAIQDYSNNAEVNSLLQIK